MNVLTGLRIAFTFCLCLSVGCNMETDTPPNDDRLVPFAGRWNFDAESTFALMEKRIDNPDAIRILRQFHTSASSLHENLLIAGTKLTGDGVPSCEYQLFALHRHGDVLCGKAWHHEDRHDPGDMSKCFIQLELIDSKLKLTVNQLDGLPDLNDPDLYSSPPTSDPNGCQTPRLIVSEPNEWAVYFFDKRKS